MSDDAQPIHSEEMSTAQRLLPLWIGLGVLVLSIVGGICIWKFGGGKYSGSRLKEINNEDVVWEGSPNNATTYSPTNFFYYMMIDLGDEAEEEPPGKFIEPGFLITSPVEEEGKDDTIWDETTSSYYQVTGLREPPTEVRITAMDDNGSKLTGRIVEYDGDKNRICELIVINGKLNGPAFIWDEKGRLLHKAEFKEGSPAGTSTIKSYDENGTLAYVRKLWFNSSSSLVKEQVYHQGKILWELGFDGAKPLTLNRWTDARFKKAIDKRDGSDIKSPKRSFKSVEFNETGLAYNKVKLEMANMYGLPKEKSTGFMKFDEETGENAQFMEPPTYGKLRENIAQTPWRVAIEAKIEAMKVTDEDSPYEKDEELKKPGVDDPDSDDNPPPDPDDNPPPP